MSKLPKSLDTLFEEIVAEAWAGGLTAAVEDVGWRSAGSQADANKRTMTDLELARRRSRWLLEGSQWDDGNEFAIGAANCRVNYAVGEDGLKYEVVANPGTPDDSPLVAEAQRFIDAFSELNDLPQLEREAVWRFDRDGEAFIRLFPGGGIPEARFIEPERIYPPPLERWPEGVSCEWGIVHPKRDRGTVLGYYSDSGDGPEFTDESQVVHLKANATSEYLRGWPTWEPVRRSLIRAEELLVAMTATGKARAKIALISEIENWNAGQADRMVNKLTERPQHQPNGDLPRKETVEDLPYGAHLRVRAGTKVNFPPANLGSADMIEAIQANLRAAAQRTNMPEWMFSGMADQKYSNAFVVEAPSLREFRALQKKVKAAFGEGRMGQRASLVWRALRMAAAAGVISPAVLTAVRIKCTAPTLEVRDKGAEATANTAYISAGVKPIPLVQQELGYDPAELKKLEEKFPKQQPPQPTPEPEPTDPLAGIAGEHFGFTADGEAWVSESAYQWLSEADRSHLVLKDVPTKDGGTVKRWIRVGAKPGAAPKPNKDPNAHGAAQSVLKDPGQLTPADFDMIPGVFKSLNKDQLRDLAHANGLSNGGTKQALCDRLLDLLKANAPKEPAGPVTGTAGGRPSSHVDTQAQRTPFYKQQHPHATAAALNDPLVKGRPNRKLPDATRPAVPDLETAQFLNNYSWGYDAEMNEALRDTDAPPPGDYGGSKHGKPAKNGPALFAALQKQFKQTKSFAPPPITVQRGIAVDQATANALLAEAEKAAASGGSIQLKGFVSTSTDKGFPGNVQYVIEAKQGLDLRPYSHFPDETELLLNHGSRYKVLKAERDPSGYTVRLHLEQLTNGA